MDGSKSLTILALTYIITFAIGIGSLLCIILPFNAMLYGMINIGMIGIMVSFLFPGIICLFIFVPILAREKYSPDVDVRGLIKRYLPLISLPLAILLYLFISCDIMQKQGKLVYGFIYYICMLCLYVFCRTIKSQNK